jgi:hypothetical protein
MTASTFTRAYVSHDLGATLHNFFRALVPIIAAVYVAGLATGNFIYWLNDRLIGRGRERWAAPARPRPVALLQPAAYRPIRCIPPAAQLHYVTQPTGPAPAVPVFEPTDALDLLTVPQLRRLARERGLSRQLYTYGRRADLIEVLNR